MKPFEIAPKFRECSGDIKYTALTSADFQTEDNATLFEHLKSLALNRGIDLRLARVLDFGCGRGAFVGFLRSKGIHAYGVEIDPKLLEAGAILLDDFQDEFPLLAHVGSTGCVPFSDGYFDIIIANQVFEHVEHLDTVASELSRLLRPSGSLLTLFPARFKVVEPHYHLALVHWLPKGNLQQFLISALVRVGFGVAPPPDMSRATMGRVIGEYAQNETFYRSNTDIGELCSANGIELDFELIPRQMLSSKLARLTGLKRWTFTVLAHLLPLVAIRNLFKSCAAVGSKRSG